MPCVHAIADGIRIYAVAFRRLIGMCLPVPGISLLALSYWSPEGVFDLVAFRRVHNRLVRFLRRDFPLLGIANRTQVLSIDPSGFRSAWFNDFNPVVPIAPGLERRSDRIKMADGTVDRR